jgi:hypothetical protein
MTLSLGDGFTNFSDTFSGLSMSDAWSLPVWQENLPYIMSESAAINTADASGGAVLSALSIDTSKGYAVEALLVPWSGEWHGKYRLHFGLDDTEPDADADGIEVELVMVGESGAFSATLKQQSEGVTTVIDSTESSGMVSPQWLTAVVDDDEVTVYLGGATILSGAVAAMVGSRVAFDMECETDGGVCLVNVFRVQYYSSTPVNDVRNLLVVSAGGNLYKETFYGVLEQITTDLSLRDDVPLQAVQSGQKLYIADYGDVAATGTDGSVAGTAFDATGVADWTALDFDEHDYVVVVSNVTGTAVAGTYTISSIAAGAVTLASDAGTGTCAYRIERAPKVYDPATDTLSILTATAGQVPTGCPLVTRYVDRLVWAGAEIAPHVWYMARQGTETDYDYSQLDSQRAVAGTSSEAGVPGSAITAIVPHNDDYLLMGCLHELWRLRGDPAYGGALDAASRTVGVLGADAWTLGPSGEFIFLSADGVYAMGPGEASAPQPISRSKLPREFLGISYDSIVSLEYDSKDYGVHLFITQPNPNDRLHWWLDWSGKTFWPVTLQGDHEPTVTCNVQSSVIEESGVLLGCRDGILRRFSSYASDDCGDEFDSYVVIGPIALNNDGSIGTIVSLDAVLAEDSGDVTCEVLAANAYEGVVSSATWDEVTLSSGFNATHYVAGQGQAFALRLTGDGLAWALENIVVTTRQMGRRRML